MKKNYYKFIKLFAFCLVIIPMFAVLFACNDPKPNNPALTKEQYSKAFVAVSNSLAENDTSANTQSISLKNNLRLSAPSGYEDISYKDDMAIILLKYFSLIMKNAQYEVTNDVIRYSMFINDYTGSVFFRQRVSFDGTNIIGFINMEVGEPGEAGHSSQANLFKINYNFETNKLVDYQVDTLTKDGGYSGKDSFGFTYRSTYFDGEKIYMLSSQDNTETSAVKEQLRNNFNVEMSKQYLTKPYDFRAEYLMVENGEV